MKNKIPAWIGNGLLAPVLFISLCDCNGRQSGKSPIVFPAFHAGACAALVIRSEGQSLRVFKQHGIWRVMEFDALTPEIRDHPADSARIQTALRKISEMRRDFLASVNPKRQQKFGADTAAGVLVEVLDSAGMSIGSFLIGKAGPEADANYARMNGSDSVYSISGNLGDVFFADESAWRDRSILRFDPALVRRLIIEKKGIALSSEKKSGGAGTWEINGTLAETVDTANIQSILSILSRLDALSWEDDTALTAEFMGFTLPQFSFTMELGDNDRRQLFIGDRKSLGRKTGCFWVKAYNGNAVYQVEESIIYELAAKCEDLLNRLEIKRNI